MYYVWKARNLALFSNAFWSVDECVDIITRECKAGLLAKGRFTPRVDRGWKLYSHTSPSFCFDNKPLLLLLGLLLL